MKKRMYCFLSLLLISSLLVGFWGAWLKYDRLRKLEIETGESIFALPFVLMVDPQLKYEVTSRTEQLLHPTQTTETEAPTETETLPVETVPPTTVTTPPETEPAKTEPADILLDESWFDDALFIGESRTAGLQSMARLGNADYFCASSLTVYGVLDIQCSDNNFGEQTLRSLLSSRTYGKIYIHLGINELGGDLDSMIRQYQRLIDVIREKQPQACIILQAVLAVSRDYSRNPVFSAESIRDLNARIEALAVDDQFRFIDVNPFFGDEEGYLRPELTYDGCHLYGSGYEQWKQWLLENAALLDIPQ